MKKFNEIYEEKKSRTKYANFGKPKKAIKKVPVKVLLHFEILNS